jgi:hypothetical protein
MSETQAPGGGTIRGDDNLDEDARQLEALGYKSHFSRTMSLAANFSLGFTYLSPLVGVYTLFAFVVAIGGAAAIWTYPIAMAGQLLVALIFAEVLSQYPIAGSPYPWALRLWGRHYAWITGWVYAWALLITIAGVAYGAGQFAAALFGVEATPGWDILVAPALLVIAAGINFSGTRNPSRGDRRFRCRDNRGCGHRYLPDPLRPQQFLQRYLRHVRNGGQRFLPPRVFSRGARRRLPVLRLRGMRRPR